jgi:hypothetical protein
MKVRAACHIHSNWSYDGSWTVEELASEFSRRGYRALMMSEHDRGFTPARLHEYREACCRASSDRILVVPGIEYSEATNTVHVLTWGKIPFLGENMPTSELLAAVKRAGGLAVLAHPCRRNAWRSFNLDWARNLTGIELWNRKADGWCPSSRAAAMIARTGVASFTGLDFHSRKQMFPIAMSLDLKGALTEESVLECLRAGRCQPYFSSLHLNQTAATTLLLTLSFLETGRRFGRWIYRKVKPIHLS